MILISIHPRFAEAILRGEKTIEFRRRWTKRPASHLVIYATSPIMQIVAVATIDEVVLASRTSLWKLAQEEGGGITRTQLFDYFDGLKSGYGIRLGVVKTLKHPINPFEKFQKFRAPQSFRFLNTDDVEKIRRVLR